jgi:hypothetical protein
MKLKIMTKPSGDFLAEAYNSAREMISVDQIEKGQRCACIVDVNQIWFIDNKFGVSVPGTSLAPDNSLPPPPPPANQPEKILKNQPVLKLMPLCRK